MLYRRPLLTDTRRQWHAGFFLISQKLSWQEKWKVKRRKWRIRTNVVGLMEDLKIWKKNISIAFTSEKQSALAVVPCCQQDSFFLLFRNVTHFKDFQSTRVEISSWKNKGCFKNLPTSRGAKYLFIGIPPYYRTCWIRHMKHIKHMNHMKHNIYEIYEYETLNRFWGFMLAPWRRSSTSVCTER